MTIKRINSHHRSINTEDLIRLEKKYSITLPEQYKDFILTVANGGTPSPRDFAYIDSNKNKISTYVNYFLALTDCDPNSPSTTRGYDTIGTALQAHRKIFLQGLFIVANLMYGVLAIRTKGANTGEVCVIEWIDGIEPRVGRVYPVAMSFQDFLDSLREYDGPY